MAAFAWVGADNKHAGEFLQLDHYYCCDAVDFESLSATAARLVKATGELPAELQARALWRFLRCEGTETLRSLDEDALDGLEALDDLAEQHGVVPRAGAPLLLEVRTQCALAHLRGREPDMPRFAKAVDALFGEDQPTTMAKSAATALRKRAAELQAIIEGAAGRKSMMLKDHPLDKALDALAAYLHEVFEAQGPSFMQQQQALAQQAQVAREGTDTAPSPARPAKHKPRRGFIDSDDDDDEPERMPATQAPLPDSEPAEEEEEEEEPAPAPKRRGRPPSEAPKPEPATKTAALPKPAPPAPKPAPPAPKAAAAAAAAPRAVVQKERTTLRALQAAYPHADFEALRDAPADVAPRVRTAPPKPKPALKKPSVAILATVSDSEAKEPSADEQPQRGGGRARRGRGAAKSVAQPRKIVRPLITAEEEEEDRLAEQLQTQAPQTQAPLADDDDDDTAVPFDDDETQPGPAATPPRPAATQPPVTSPPMSAGRSLLHRIYVGAAGMVGGLLGASAALKETGVDPLAEALQQAATAVPGSGRKPAAKDAAAAAAANENELLLPGGKVRINMFERGATARTVEWGSPGSSLGRRKQRAGGSDSDEVSDPEEEDDDEDDADAPARKRRLHLPSTDGAAAAAVRAPLAPLAVARGGGGGGGSKRAARSPAAARSPGAGRRRARLKWSAEEEELLIRLVAQMGSSWASVLAAGRDDANGFNPIRTQVDLKDKWRNLVKSGRV